MASNLFLSSSSKSSSKLTNDKTNVVDLLVKCGTEIKNQSVAALGKTLCKYESTRTMPPAMPELQPPTSTSSCPIRSAVSSLCRALPSQSSAGNSFQFIDPSELMKSLYEITKKPFLILLDCRPFTEFNNKHIKDSVHLNCRDKLTKKKLQTQKITIRDLISCELTKSKLDVAASGPLLNNEQPPSLTQSLIAEPARISLASRIESIAASSDENMIVIYDDTTSDDKDLLVDSNPLKIVQENIAKAGIKKECKILKGGFKQFAQMCPELCRSELKKAATNLAAAEQLQDQHQSVIDTTQMTEITPYLFLGNELDARDVTKLAQHGIYYILNVTRNIPFYQFSSEQADSAAKFVFKRIEVNDSFGQKLKEHFDEAFEFIDEARRNNCKVLVHCQAGVSRSPTIVIAYLMRQFGISINEAYNRVRELRPIIAPNICFMSQLMDYDNKLRSSQFSTLFSNCSANSGSMNDTAAKETKSTEANKSPIECN